MSSPARYYRTKEKVNLARQKSSDTRRWRAYSNPAHQQQIRNRWFNSLDTQLGDAPIGTQATVDNSMWGDSKWILEATYEKVDGGYRQVNKEKIKKRKAA
ncbi:MAG: hypothetical protein ABIE22_05490 [archaeon]